MHVKNQISRIVFGLLSFIAIMFALAKVGHAEEIRVVPGQILVKPAKGFSETDFTALLKTHGAREKSNIGSINVRIVGVPEDKVETVLAALSHNPNIQFAERDFVASASYVPNDPYYASGYQWHHGKVQTPTAWDTTQGRTNIIVAVLDTGVDLTHPDLVGKILPGYNYVSNNTNPADDQGHGTAVAGTAAATGNNLVGVAGVSMQSYILPVKVLDSTGNGSYSAIANGITYAANKGARVINLSVGGPSSSSSLQSAIDYAWSKNCVIIASAGNNANNTPQYPAACRNVVGVSATDSNDALASFSSYGSYVSVSAPGQGIWTTSRGGGYGGWSGTSFSSPLTAGVAALVASANGQLSNAQIVNILKTSSDDIGVAGYDVSFGYGRVNAAKAVAAAGGSTVSDTIVPTVSVLSPVAGSTVSGSTTVSLSSSDNVGVTKTEIYLDGVLVGSSTSASANFSWDTTTHANGSATLQARAYDAAGNVGVSQSVTVTVSNTVVAPTPDTTAPRIQITSPVNGASVGKNVKVSVAAQDNVSVSRIELYVDGRYFGVSYGSTATFSWNRVSNGQHTLQAFAYDGAGNRGQSSTVTVSR